MADKIVVRPGGQAEQIGCPMAGHDAPADAVAAGVIGAPAMNLPKGRLGADGRSFDPEGGGAPQFDAALGVAAGPRM